MCIIIAKDFGNKLDGEQLDNAVSSNRDGIGYAAYNRRTHKVSIGKGLDRDKAMLTETVKKLAASKDVRLVFHARIRTAGLTDDGRCHPFQIGETDWYLFHNGIIHYASKDIEHIDWSDTQQFAADTASWLSMGYSLRSVFKMNKAALAGSKLVAFNATTGAWRFWNAESGLSRKGNWYSNHSAFRCASTTTATGGNQNWRSGRQGASDWDGEYNYGRNGYQSQSPYNNPPMDAETWRQIDGKWERVDKSETRELVADSGAIARDEDTVIISDAAPVVSEQAESEADETAIGAVLAQGETASTGDGTEESEGEAVSDEEEAYRVAYDTNGEEEGGYFAKLQEELDMETEREFIALESELQAALAMGASLEKSFPTVAKTAPEYTQTEKEFDEFEQKLMKARRNLMAAEENYIETAEPWAVDDLKFEIEKFRKECEAEKARRAGKAITLQAEELGKVPQGWKRRRDELTRLWDEGEIDAAIYNAEVNKLNTELSEHNRKERERERVARVATAMGVAAESVKASAAAREEAEAGAFDSAKWGGVTERVDV